MVSTFLDAKSVRTALDTVAMSNDIASLIEPKSVPAVTDTLRDWVKDFDDRHRISMSEVHAELSQELEDSLAAALWSKPPRFMPLNCRLVKPDRAQFVKDMALKCPVSSE